MLIENWNVEKFHFEGLVQQTLAGSHQGLKTLEVWLVTLEPGYAAPPYDHFGEVVMVILNGSGRALVGDQSFDLVAHTTLSIPPQYPPAGQLQRQRRSGGPSHHELEPSAGGVAPI